MRRNYPVLNPLGLIVLIFGLLMGIPLALSWFSDDSALAAHNQAMLITCAVGVALWAGTRKGRRELRVHDSFLLVALTWAGLPVFAALPLWLYMPDMSFTDAYFEATAGLTATGATVMAGVDALPVSITFWRALLHWIGGLGVLVLAAAVLPLLGIGGRQMFKAEATGTGQGASLTPRITDTTKGLWMVYVLLTLACMLSLMGVGLPGGKALMQALAIMGRGGFAARDATLGHFNAVPIELVAMVFALLSGMNFSTHYQALRRRSLQPYRHDRELPFYLGVLAVTIVALTVYLSRFDIYPDPGTALRYVAFHGIGLSTSLGFATSDYAAWPLFGQLCILFLGSFIACSGSTGGGIKLMRAIILYKQVFREVIHAVHPAAVKPVRVGQSQVPDKILHAVLAFSFIYMCTIVSLTLLLSATGLELITAFSAVVATLNNTGPGLNAVGAGANYAVLNDFQTWICAAAMLLGRLEIFTLLVVLTPGFWRK
ncbi:TrkH family potassium uptake protein [Nitrogeniibacter mangrovi]|uniref:Trk system potassium uptake protein n=1 Tax=Nitrogeniibacter mangrovi TaxID=2016596 RepID=A0A6C1BBI9_9RHOO|nr:potassium transporter TrkG [Nitrogeniibacter mangrovi]QID19644.1 TrkH family potassium uptake protein [Nitrogeniibacter mangrovi]